MRRCRIPAQRSTQRTAGLNWRGLPQDPPRSTNEGLWFRSGSLELAIFTRITASVHPFDGIGVTQPIRQFQGRCGSCRTVRDAGRRVDGGAYLVDCGVECIDGLREPFRERVLATVDRHLQ